ncbi:hypothetical protein [Kaarinaea lacus]
MDKRQRHNLLLILAIVILLIGVASQVYLMVESGENPVNQPATESTIQN